MSGKLSAKDAMEQVQAKMTESKSASSPSTKLRCVSKNMHRNFVSTDSFLHKKQALEA